MYVKVFIVNVNKLLKPFFLEQHINIVNRVTLQSFWFIFTLFTRLDKYRVFFHTSNRKSVSSSYSYLAWTIQVNVLLSNCKQNITSLSLLVGMAVHVGKKFTYSSQTIPFHYVSTGAVDRPVRGTEDTANWLVIVAFMATRNR